MLVAAANKANWRLMPGVWWETCGGVPSRQHHLQTCVQMAHGTLNNELLKVLTWFHSMQTRRDEICMGLGNSSSLVEEMHRLRRDCDFTKVTQNLEQVRTLTTVYPRRNAIGCSRAIWKFPRLSDQVEPALRGLRQAVRENRVNCEDLVPLTEEARHSLPLVRAMSKHVPTITTFPDSPWA